MPSTNRNLFTILLVLVLLASCGPSRRDVTLARQVDGTRPAEGLLQRVAVVDSFFAACLDSVASSDCFNALDYYLITITSPNGAGYDAWIDEFVYDSLSARYTALYTTVNDIRFFIHGGLSALFSIVDSLSSLPYNSEADFCYPHGDYQVLLKGQAGESCKVVSCNCSE
jgi:hypothetical protein